MKQPFMQKQIQDFSLVNGYSGLKTSRKDYAAHGKKNLGQLAWLN